MKNKVLIILILLLGSCSTHSDPRKVTDKFLGSFYSYDIKEAKNYADTSSIEELDYIEKQFENVDKKELQKSVYQIHECFIDGDTARCRYTLKDTIEDQAAVSEYLLLVKRGKKWKVIY